MNILLIKPSFQKMYKKLSNVTLHEPLGLEYIADMIIKNHKVKILDLEIENKTDKEFIDYIKNNQSDIIGFTVPTPTIGIVRNLVNQIKQELNIPIIIGGPHPSALPEQSLKDTGADIAVVGEGEKTFSELIEAYTAHNKFDPEVLKNINGICYKRNNEYVTTPKRELIQDIDSIPFPARGLVNRTKYKYFYSASDKVNFYATVLTSRGCPSQCIFCASKCIFGSKFRARSPENICDEIEEILKINIKWIYFVDDCFTLDIDRTEKICNEIINRKLDIKWFAETRVNTINEKILRLMKKAGCELITYGIESGNQRVLEVIKKGITIEQIKKAFKLSRKVGIKTRANFMLGHSTETYKEALDTIKLAKKIKPYDAGFYITLPIPGSKIYEIAMEKNLITSENLENLMWYGMPQITLSEIPLKELKKLQQKAYKEFYLRPEFVIDKLLNLKSLNEVKSLLSGVKPLQALICGNK